MPMCALRIDPDGLSNSVLPSLQKSKTYLNSAKSKVSSINIPSDFTDSATIRSAISSISSIISQLNGSYSGIQNIISSFLAMQSKNSALIQNLADNISLEQQNLIKDRINKTIQEILAITNPGGGKGSVDSNGKSMYHQNTYLETMQSCWKKLYENGKNISYAPACSMIPFDWSAENWNPSNSGYADCSSFVSWTLYEYGYEEFGNEQHLTYDFVNQANLDRWKEEYGWKINTANNGSEAAEKVKAGDIVALKEHMFIVKDKKTDGTIVTLDAGWQTHWTNKETQSELGLNNTYPFIGSIEGTTSGYFSPDNERHNESCNIITIEDITWDDINLVKSFN